MSIGKGRLAGRAEKLSLPLAVGFKEIPRRATAWEQKEVSIGGGKKIWGQGSAERALTV